MAARQSRANTWFLHRITGTFLIFLLVTHFWVQHYDTTTATVSEHILTTEQIEEGEMPEYSEEAQAAVRAQIGAAGEVTPYDVAMLRLADPVYAVLWKGFNILFLIFALHHGFYGLNNILTDYIRNPIGRKMATTLSWTLALALFVIGLYSILTAGLNYQPPGM